ncbi:hypothetical protein [Actinomyces sp. ZJ308]|uniref:hypothetical protein n=1 Tax=Actinomyces sp. ZJ308 TaxID=2708342 RepID=UPI00141DE7A7|nr:hypothetical protein [Actinomyces sp. ZJ308]
MTSLPSHSSLDTLPTNRASTPSQPPAGGRPPLTVRPGWLTLLCGVLTGLVGVALIGLAAFMVTVGITRGTLGEIAAVSAAIAVFGLLLLAVPIGVTRIRTVVSSEGLELHSPTGRVKKLSWQQAHNRIWISTAHMYGSWSMTVCKVVVALDEKEVVLPGAYAQGIFRKRTEARAERIVERINAMDPMNG